MAKGKVWGKKEIAIILVVLLMICVAIATVAIIVNKNNPEGVADENIAENISAAEVSENIKDKFDNELDYSLSDAINEYESAMNTGNNTYKVYVAVYYATFIYDIDNDIDEAIDILGRVESLIDDNTAVDYYVALRQLYSIAGMDEEAEFYNQKVLELIPQSTRPIETLMEDTEVQE